MFELEVEFKPLRKKQAFFAGFAGKAAKQKAADLNFEAKSKAQEIYKIVRARKQ